MIVCFREHVRGILVLAALLGSVAVQQSTAQCNCNPLPPPQSSETVVYANNSSEVLSAIANAAGKTTIFLNSGTYQVSSSVFINVSKPDITIRSTSGNRDDVIIQGEGMDATGLGMGIYIDADNITIADLTVREVQNHGFFVNPGADNCLFHNVRGVDCGEQIFKASGYAALPPKNNGIIECSTFEYTTTLDDGDDGWYTNGIDILNCHNWIIRDNVIRNIKHNPAITSNLAGPAILAWHGCSNTIVERNRIIECDFGISFGNAGQGGVSHTGGIIRNNFVLGYADSDFGIGLIYAPGATVINNTVYSPGGWQWGIEARFAETTNCIIMNNLCDEPIWPDRGGASCVLSTNISDAVPADFVSISTGDLHLSSGAVSAVNAGSVTQDRSHDIDCHGITGLPDIGADEFASTPTGIDLANVADNIEVYPLPSSGIVTVTGYDIRQVFVHDLNGKLIREYETSSEGVTIEMRSEPKGVYFMKIITDAYVVSKRVVVK
jgi:type IX secretion system substrate protein